MYVIEVRGSVHKFWVYIYTAFLVKREALELSVSTVKDHTHSITVPGEAFTLEVLSPLPRRSSAIVFLILVVGDGGGVCLCVFLLYIRWATSSGSCTVSC